MISTVSELLGMEECGLMIINTLRMNAIVVRSSATFAVGSRDHSVTVPGNAIHLKDLQKNNLQLAPGFS